MKLQDVISSRGEDGTWWVDKVDDRGVYPHRRSRMSERGTHLGDGAYIVPDQHGPHQLWLCANSHTNPVVALDPAAFEEMARWIKHWAPRVYVEALERGLK